MKKRWIPWALVLVSVAGVLAVSVGYFFEVRASLERSSARWVKRVADILGSDRQEFRQWVQQIPRGISNADLFSQFTQQNGVVAVLETDLASHHTQRWAAPVFSKFSRSMDAPLAVLQLKAQETGGAQVGPVLHLGVNFFYMAALPLEHQRILTVVRQTTHPAAVLEEESRFFGVHCTVYDMDRRLIYSSRRQLINASELGVIVRNIQDNKLSGFIWLNGVEQLSWLATYHYDPASEWIFIIVRPAAWFYTPVLFFFAALIGVIWLLQIAVEQTSFIRLRHQTVELQQWARRVESFIHGREPSLKDPPYPFSELSVILNGLRWLMPQWQKAEAYPKELALERKLLSILVESLPEAILFFNVQGTLQLSNELGRVFFGMQQEAGREYKMQNGLQIPRGFLEKYVEPVFTGQQMNSANEVEVPWADGKYLYRIWVERIEEIEGKANGYIVVIRDITFRRNWEYVQEQLLSGITHDLRGPLSAVMGYIDLMKRQINETGNAKLAEYLKLARDAGVRLTQMVSDILDVVRFEQGKIDLEITAISVQDIFTQLKNTYGVAADQKKINLSFELNGSRDAKTYGDPKLLERIFDNLVGNAIKFTPSGGKITVSARKGDKRMTFSIADTGRGIPREAQSRIFDKFQQVRPGDRSAGYGLGLAVVKFIVQAHKGEIRVESEVGNGSCFTLWIPEQPVGLQPETMKP